MLAIAIAEHLDDQVPDVVFSATTAGGNTFVGMMPDRPDLAVMVMPTGGPPQPTLDPSDTATLQILVRAARGAMVAAHDLTAAIYGALAGLDHTTLDAYGDHEVFVIGTTGIQSAPTYLGLDDVGRPEFTLNFDVQFSNPTTHRPSH